MQLAIAGWPVAGRSESLLETITRRLRTGWRSLIDALTSPGKP
ncbi:protease FtsH-inhibitory lysogeny factor CIII [Erwinia sp. P6884]|jgi:hypothetical protein